MYKCTMVTGGGTIIDQGDWEMKETPKSWTFTRIRKGQTYGFDGDRMVCKKDMRCNHPCTDWEDGTYSVYPNRCGNAFYFEPI